MIAEHLARALAVVMMILADATKSGISSHTALNALESIAYELEQMDLGERRELVQVLERIATISPSEQAQFIRAIPDALGLQVD